MSHTRPLLKRRQALGLGAGLAASLAWPSFAGAAPASGMPARRRVEVLGHRGACALRPEHTLASYAKAIADGADFVEPDLVITKDGHLVARHENEIGGTTDVAQHPEFASRRRTLTIDGVTATGWFVSDFTLAELKTLRCRERIPEVRPGNTRYDGQFQIATWEEIIDFVAAESATRGREIGLVPEIKHSTFFAAIGLPIEDRFIAQTQAHAYTRQAPLIVQSFELANLRYLRQKLGRPDHLRLMQLTGDPHEIPADVIAAGGKTSFGQVTSPEGLRELARTADILSPPTRVLIPVDAQQRLQAASPVIADAHAAGLAVHCYTFRPENRFLSADYRDSEGDNARNDRGAIAEIQHYIAAGIDGFFTDDSAIGRQAVDGPRV